LPSGSKNGKYLKLRFSYSENLWPWTGYLAIEIQVVEEAHNFDGIVEGQVVLEVESTSPDSGKALRSELSLFVRAKIIATPPRKQRILWDQWHNLRYPSGYFPRDNLKIKNDPLDWNADHASKIK
jgi:membrane-bound transcription factor site-1 protease